MIFLGEVKSFLSAEIVEKLEQLSDEFALIHQNDLSRYSFDPQTVVVLVDSITPEQVVIWHQQYQIGHIVALDTWSLWGELCLAFSLISQRQEFEKGPAHFLATNAQKCDPWQKELSIKFNQASQKESILEKVSNFVDHIPKSRTMHQDVLSIVDELFTNAIFHSPVSNTLESQKRSQRDTTVALQSGIAANLVVAHNNKGIFIGVEDPFGGLKLEQIFSRLLACYAQGVGRVMNMGPGGAGIGLFMLFNLSISMIFSVEENKSSFVCCVLPIGVSLKRKETMGKSLHVLDHKLLKGAS